MKSKSFIYVLLFIIVIGIASCTKSNTMILNTKVSFNATLTGASETPPNSSTATGTAAFVYDNSTYILTGTVTFAGITPTGAHIHKGDVGVAGAIIFPLAGAGTITSPISFTSSVLDSTQRADLLANMYYVNIHSAAFPGGEIRGQLIQEASSATGGGTYMGGGTGY